MVFALVAVGCDSEGRVPPPTVKSADGGPTATPTPERELPKARLSTPAGVEWPFEPYLAAAVSGQMAYSAQMLEARADWFAQVEDATAACMKRQGFDYWPQSYPATAYTSLLDLVPSVGDLPFAWLPEDRAEAARVGYGVISPDEYDAVFVIAPTPDEPEDPNTAYALSLGAEAAAAYELALTGRDMNSEVSDGGLASLWTGSGCRGEAWSRYPEPAGSGVGMPEWISEPVERMSAVISDPATSQSLDADLEANFHRDPAYTELTAEWVACMDAAGYAGAWFGQPLASPETALAYALTVGEDGKLPETGAAGAAGAAGEGEILLIDDLRDDQRSLVGSEHERRVALADFDCRASTDYIARYTAAMIDAQQRHIDSHRAELDRLVSLAEQLNN
ncbi:MAG: hypothetical protein LBG60_04715 [Bifidobacteriaceae bacterium]|nr:hypothetical protein [Bifidobacteriaceae bacterium]